MKISFRHSDILITSLSQKSYARYVDHVSLDLSNKPSHGYKLKNRDLVLKEIVKHGEVYVHYKEAERLKTFLFNAMDRTPISGLNRLRIGLQVPELQTSNLKNEYLYLTREYSLFVNSDRTVKAYNLDSSPVDAVQLYIEQLYLSAQLPTVNTPESDLISSKSVLDRLNNVLGKETKLDFSGLTTDQKKFILFLRQHFRKLSNNNIYDLYLKSIQSRFEDTLKAQTVPQKLKIKPFKTEPTFEQKISFSGLILKEYANYYKGLTAGLAIKAICYDRKYEDLLRLITDLGYISTEELKLIEYEDEPVRWLSIEELASFKFQWH